MNSKSIIIVMNLLFFCLTYFFINSVKGMENTANNKNLSFIKQFLKCSDLFTNQKSAFWLPKEIQNKIVKHVLIDSDILFWLIHKLRMQTLRLKHDDVITCAMFNNNDQHIITVSGKAVSFWKASNGKYIGNLIEQKNILFAQSNNDLMAVVLEDGMVRVSDRGQIKQNFLLEGHQFPVACVSFSNDSSKIITAYKDGLIKIWN